MRVGIYSAALALGIVIFVGCEGSRTPTQPEQPADRASSDLAVDPGKLDAPSPEPAGGVDRGAEEEAQVEELAATAKSIADCSSKKVAVCHLPPGNPSNIQQICIGTASVPAHEAHGDYLPLTFYPDADGDGFGSAAAAGEQGCVVPPGFVEDNTDCDDGDAAVNPAAAEVLCDGIDNNCNGLGDDDVNADGDPVSFCDGDCDDADADRYPGNTEDLCDGVDQDCDGLGDDDVNADGDPVSFCDGDCDDADDDRYPGNTEDLCDGVDQDCDGLGDDDVNADGDPVTFCDGDCDDSDAGRYPGNTETCGDGVDNDCDGEVDPPAICGGDPPVAVDDNFIGPPHTFACILPSCAGPAQRTCVLNATAGAITGNDSDPDSTFDAMINGPIVMAGWTCNGDNLCTTDAGFVGAASSLTVNADGSFNLTYSTTQNFPFGGEADIVIAEFLYFLEDPGGNTSGNARVMIPVHCP